MTTIATSSSKSSSFSVGWDVGAWNCDRNGTSRDGLVILDAALGIVGEPWRGNLRQTISASSTTQDWIRALFALCGAALPDITPAVAMAIDIPLGFPTDLVALITDRRHIEPDPTSGHNRYLFRQTERHLFARGHRPLSSIKDMIGSQATKGIHAVAKFAPRIERCGVWSDGQSFHAIETYPAVCRKAPRIQTLLTGRPSLGHSDKDDAFICALVAHLFFNDYAALEAPAASVPMNEGWIWVPAL